MKNRLNDTIQSKVLMLDGAMGTMLQSHGIPAGACPEQLNITKPDLIRQIHQEYVDAGADILITNTFGANRCKLAEYGCEDTIRDINKAGIELAREASKGNALVACSIAPTGKFIEPVGDMSFDAAYDIYTEQISLCIDAGVDLIALETFGDIKEIKAAFMAAREVAGGSFPVLAMMTFQDNCRTILGTSPESAAAVLDTLGADAIGANCSLGPDFLLSIVKRMRSVTGKPFVVQPNAGMPELKDGLTSYPATPAEMAQYTPKFIEQGVRVIGGCCGTTPEHIRSVAREAGKTTGSTHFRTQRGLIVSNRTDPVRVGDGKLTKRIGERINPTGKPTVIEKLKAGKVSKVVEMAIHQVQSGADILDINVGAPGVDECVMMEKVVKAVQQSVTVPLMIDSQNAQVIEAGLKSADGKVIVNSVTGEKEKLEAVLPLVKKYGASVLGLTLDQTGIPKTAEKRIEIAEKIITAAREYGIATKDIIIDCLALTVSAEQDQAAQTLQAIRAIKGKYDVSTILGVSNVSFGLPERSFLNASFLSMAVDAGLDAAIINPSDLLVSHILSAADVLTGRDRRGEEYIKSVEGKKGKVIVSVGGTADSPHSDKNGSTSCSGDDIRGAIFQGVVQGNKDNIVHLVETALREGIPPLEIGNDMLIPALAKVGDLFENKTFFLPQMILSAETMQIAFDRIKKDIDVKDSSFSKGKIVMATVHGDIHDIGKNIVVTMLKNYGYDVIDMGKSVSAEEIVECAAHSDADIVGLSALMTTTMVEMEKVIRLIRNRGLSVSTILGGAVVTAKYTRSIGADAYAKDALDAVKKANGLIEAGKSARQ